MNIENNLNEILDIAHNELYDRVNSLSYKTWEDYKKNNGINFYKDILNTSYIVNENILKSYFSKNLYQVNIEQLNINFDIINKIKIQKMYDISVKLSDRELNLDMENFTNEIIQPSMAALKNKIQDFYFIDNEPIIIPNFTYDLFIIKYDKNIGLGIDYQDSILSFRIVCGKLI